MIGGVISRADMLNHPRYISMVADFIKSTGLIGQYQAFDEGQEQGLSRANGQRNRTRRRRGGPGDVGYTPASLHTRAKSHGRQLPLVTAVRVSMALCGETAPSEA